jgi:hypothetical protein
MESSKENRRRGDGKLAGKHNQNSPNLETGITNKYSKNFS